MNYNATLLVVKEMGVSRAFYTELLGLTVTADFGANITFSGGISLQTEESWLGFLGREEKDLSFAPLVSELYFEEAEMDAFLKRLNAFPGIRLAHPLLEHRWGQRAVRFFDPDGHLIEVGEEMDQVVGRFLKSGMSQAEAALRMDVSESYIAEACARLAEKK